jgi:hypothetical protein
VLWLNDDLERMGILRELRESMTPGERSRLNSPITARKRVESIVKARAGGTEESLSISPIARMKDTIFDQAREITELQQKLAKHENGSLFDLKADRAEDIATTIVNSVSEHKAKAIASGIAARYKQQKKPAG